MLAKLSLSSLGGLTLLLIGIIGFGMAEDRPESGRSGNDTTSRVSTANRGVAAPQYVTVEEVTRVCLELGLQNWALLRDDQIPLKDAAQLQTVIGAEALSISVESFRDALDVELEHGLRFPDANVTNNHPVLTGRIVLAHLKESLDYYERLEVAELEADLAKAIEAADSAKTATVYRKLIAARKRLTEAEQARFARQSRS